MTIFEIKSERSISPKFRRFTRETYKENMRQLNKPDAPKFRTGTEYRDGEPVKQCTILQEDT